MNTYNASSDTFRPVQLPRQEMAAADLDELEDAGHVRSVSPRAKAKAIKEIARLVQENGRQVPRDIEAMTKWPMVGRKTANCVMAYAFKEPAICVDAHVHRISNRIGIVDCDTPDETEMALREEVPQGAVVRHKRHHGPLRAEDMPSPPSHDAPNARSQKRSAVLCRR